MNTVSHTGAVDARRFRVGDLVVDLVARTVERDGAHLAVKGLSFELLACLVRCYPELASTREINSAVWGENVVGSSTLTQRIKLLREALAGSDRYPDYIETVKSRGYRLVVPVEPIDRAPSRSRQSRWWLAAGALAVVLVAGAWLLRPLAGPGPVPEAGTRTLYVLPMQSSGDDVEWAEGLRQEIMDRLRGIGDLAVTPVHSLPAEPGDWALTLEFELAESGDGAELLSTLSDPGSGEVLSRRRIPGAGAGQNPLLVALAVTEDVGAAVAVGPAPPVVEAEPPADPRAYELFLRARYHGSQYARSDLQRGVRLLDRALEIAPDFARAYELRSLIYSLAGTPSYGWMTPGEAFEHARRDALQALALDPGLTLANVTLGNILLWHEWNAPAAAIAYRRALELTPNSLSAWLSIALLYTATGRYDESVAAIDRAVALAPMQAGVYANAGWRLLGARRHGEALAAAQTAQSLDPTLRDAYDIQVWAQVFLGHPERAREVSDDYVSDTARGYLLAVSGQETEARKHLQAMIDSGRDGYVSPTGIAIVSIGLGDYEQALDWLELVVGQRSREALFFRSSTIYDPLRDHPRFRELLARVGISDDFAIDPIP